MGKNIMWQMKNKRGIMVQFLVTIILALIIFAPACYVTSKILFRTSEQAKDNYVEFAGELSTFAKEAKFGERKSILLIMDEKTAMVYFEKGKREVMVEVDARAPYTDYTIHLQKPGQCDDTKNCLCLFRKSKFEVGLDTITFTPKRVICTNLDYKLEVETCSIGKPNAVHSYACSNGFMIERNLAADPSIVASYYELPRRTVLYFTKFENSVRLIGDYGGDDEQKSS